MRARIWRVLAGGVVALAFLAAPDMASAATQLGQVAPGDPGDCAGDFNAVQSSTAAEPRYVVPSGGGVITSWQHRADMVVPGSGRLQLWRREDGTNFRLVGRSELHVFTAGGINSFPTQIPVTGGELLGLRRHTTLGCIFFTMASADATLSASGTDPVPGELRNLQFGGSGFTRLNVAATLEPDADGDGFGDETQDQCPGQAGPVNGCPEPEPEPTDNSAPSTTITKGPKDKTKKKTATFEFTGTDAGAISSFQCKLDSGAFAPCSSPHTVKVKKGKHTFAVQAIDQAGNVGPPATDDWKVKKKRKK